MFWAGPGTGQGSQRLEQGDLAAGAGWTPQPRCGSCLARQARAEEGPCPPSCSGLAVALLFDLRSRHHGKENSWGPRGGSGWA